MFTKFCRMRKKKRGKKTRTKGHVQKFDNMGLSTSILRLSGLISGLVSSLAAVRIPIHAKFAKQIITT